MARRIFQAPRSLFDANIFYPHGLSLAYSEPMLVPAVVTFAPAGTLFVSHLLIGVKGAAPGTAVEAFGLARLTRVIGRPDRGDLLITRGFRLE